MKKGLIVGLILVIALCAVGGLIASNVMKQMRAAAEAAKADTAKVVRGEVAVRVIETGFLESIEDVEVKSLVGGRLEELLVEEGDEVERGELLAVIEPVETELQVRQGRQSVIQSQASIDQLEAQIAQRRVTVETQLKRAASQVRQIEQELKAQPTLTKTAITAAEANLAAARQAHKMLTDVTHPNERIAVQNEVRDAQANLTNVQLEYERQKSLYDKGYVSRRVFEQAELSVSLAESRLRAAEQRQGRLSAEQDLEAQQSLQSIEGREADLRRAKANSVQDDVKQEQYRQALLALREAEAAKRDLDSLHAQLRGQIAGKNSSQIRLSDSERLLGETNIRAPFNGVVARKYLEIGELVSPLSGFSPGTSILLLENRNAMLVRLEVNEIDVAKLELGMPAKITVDAFPDEEYEGFVRKIAPSNTTAGLQGGQAGAPGGSVVKYEVEVQLDDAPEHLKTGMSASCTMTVSHEDSALRLPVSYVGAEVDGSRFVMLVVEGEEPKRTPVEVGVSSGAFIEILGGVEEGDEVEKPEFDGPPRVGMFSGGGEGGGDGEQEDGGG